ncbi:MAG: signal peptidase II [Armatimonadetes bacterium]|nr:signal peptidase II [Armatimonadota bacterium]
MTRVGIYSLAALVLAADQITKHWVARAHRGWPLTGGDYSREVIPGFFSLTYAQNTGGAFSILQSSTLLLALASAAAALAIVIYTLRHRGPLPGLLAVALGGALGGALGNLMDRVRLHYVVDFLDLHVGAHQWPIFNVADSAICLGVALLALHYARAETPRPAPSRSSN